MMSLRTAKRLLKCFLGAGRHIPQWVFAQVAGVLVLSLVAAGGASGQNASADDFNNAATIDTTSAIVQLKSDPVSTYPGTKPPRGQKINFKSTTVRSYRAQLAAERNDFRDWLRTNAPKVV
jgi:hypothetical protein